MTDLTQAKKPISRQQYANLIATRNLMQQYPEHYCQSSWCRADLYCFAGFAALVKEGRKVGDVLPNRDPNLAEWLGMTPKEYIRACYSIKTLDGLLAFIESLLDGRVLYGEVTPQVATPQRVTPQVVTPQVATPREKVKSDGYTSPVYDRDGYDKRGYNRDGLNKKGQYCIFPAGC
jgi:hypothetical protein